MNKFVVASKNIKSQNVLVEKGDVGIIKTPQAKPISVFFIRVWREVILHENDFQIFDVKRTGDGFSKKSVISATNFLTRRSLQKIKMQKITGLFEDPHAEVAESVLRALM